MWYRKVYHLLFLLCPPLPLPNTKKTTKKRERKGSPSLDIDFYFFFEKEFHITVTNSQRVSHTLFLVVHMYIYILNKLCFPFLSAFCFLLSHTPFSSLQSSRFKG
jgi:hypothetical protein